ncbi:tyrosine-type recombinase/integrase [Enterococcus faecium]|uniref:site-specific integrase n=1 Tax=Enterococcus TaxID=1350 RepID=UPI000A35469A|nr:MULTISPECIES: site-specific integrase [Enterococcus]EGP4883255.1 site-specific integrase [Enterococcus faecium]EGP4954522.1 site-specific integrase [Enterococcus faecium]EGP5034867.1 site-specific integrase [Enterococcus faecium]EGP5148716.1 site-specific integrase [Enterococcus faecium]EGP5196490.1 site-specific integrase [Enterococcus faecium]
MSIQKYKIKSGTRYSVRLYVRKDENGKQEYYVKKGFKTEKEAKLHEARKKVEIEDIGYHRPSNDLYRTVYEEWLPSYKNRVQETTYQRTKDLFRLHILPKFGDKSISKITPVHCQNAINEWAVKYTNIKQLKSYSSQIFEYAIFAELLQRNPMTNTKLPHREKKESENYFSLEELKKFLEILNKEESLKHILIFQLLITTGVRKGELSALRWADINFEEQLLHIGKSYATIRTEDPNATRKTIRIQKNTKNVSSERILPIDFQTIELLKLWKKEQAEELLQFGINTKTKKQLIFTYVNADGAINQPLHADYSNNIMKRLEKKYKLKHVTIHGLRHTHATLLLEGGASIKETQDRLGHKNAETTLNTYSHVTEKAQRNAVDKFIAYTGL